MVPDRAWLEAPVAALSWRSDGQDLRLRRVNETADALTKGAASKFVGCSVDEIFVDAPELVELVEDASAACDVRELELDFSSLGMNIHARTRFRAVGIEPSLRSAAQRRREVIEFLRAALVPANRYWR